MSRPQIISTEIETCTGHRLMDYNGLCAHLHGHNYRWVVSVCTPVENVRHGLAIDFSVLKALVKDATSIFDHALILRNDDSFTETVKEANGRLVILSSNPTAENLAQLVADNLVRSLPFVEWVNVELWETSKHRVSARGTASPSPDLAILFCNSGVPNNE